MTIRSMVNTFEGREFYRSLFDQKTGILVRETEWPEEHIDKSSHWRNIPFYPHLAQYLFKDEIGEMKDYYRNEDTLAQELGSKWKEQFGYRKFAFSPSPETLDVQVTNWCAFGCSFCYQESTPKEAHGAVETILGSIKAFDHAPYQVAFGGGEPTSHPEFASILEETRLLGSVPNYTTAGQPWAESKNEKLLKNLVDATVKNCGGVALTYHSWKGDEYFVKAYQAMRETLTGLQLNVHLVCDKDADTRLEQLVYLADKHNLGRLNIVLLAYLPVGRGSWESILPKKVFNHTFPVALQKAVDKKHLIAYSEGMLPYFVSRPELPIVTKGAEISEGIYSAYIDKDGVMTRSSFEGSDANNPSLEKGDLQAGWSTNTELGNNRVAFSWDNDYTVCDTCEYKDRCGPCHDVAYFMCSKVGFE